jgi:hypothetical protein
MAAKLIRLTHKIALQLHLVAERLPFAVLAPGGQSRNFGIHPRIPKYLLPVSELMVISYPFNDPPTHVTYMVTRQQNSVVWATMNLAK